MGLAQARAPESACEAADSSNAAAAGIQDILEDELGRHRTSSMFATAFWANLGGLPSFAFNSCFPVATARPPAIPARLDRLRDPRRRDESNKWEKKT
ncbi:MAG: hypothetical protein ACLQIQ_16330 [Beijerinckiaceae bacterium]